MRRPDIYGGWQPETLTDLLYCDEEECIVRAGEVPAWVNVVRAENGLPVIPAGESR